MSEAAPHLPPRVVVVEGSEPGRAVLDPILRAGGFTVVGNARSQDQLQALLDAADPNVIVFDAETSAETVAAAKTWVPHAGRVVVWPAGVVALDAEEHVDPERVVTDLSRAVHAADDRHPIVAPRERPEGSAYYPPISLAPPANGARRESLLALAMLTLVTMLIVAGWPAIQRVVQAPDEFGLLGPAIAIPDRAELLEPLNLAAPGPGVETSVFTRPVTVVDERSVVTRGSAFSAAANDRVSGAGSRRETRDGPRRDAPSGGGGQSPGGVGNGGGGGGGGGRPTPGNSPNASGHGGGGPGNSANAPGHAPGGSPGNSANAPGHAPGGSPGNSANAPGHRD